MKSELVMWDDIGLLDYIGDVENIYIPSFDGFEYRDSENGSAKLVTHGRDVNKNSLLD